MRKVSLQSKPFTCAQADDVPLEPKANPSGTILKLKPGEDGTGSRFKAIVVAGANLQTNDFNHVDIYASLACI